MNEFVLSVPIHVDEIDGLSHIRWSYGPYEFRTYDHMAVGKIWVQHQRGSFRGRWITGGILEAVALAQQMEEGKV